VTALQVTGVGSCGVDLSKIGGIAEAVARAARRGIGAFAPVVGKRIAVTESGLHVRASSVRPAAYRAFDPSSMGGTMEEIVLGKHSGRAAVVEFAKKYDVALSAEDAFVVLGRVKERSESLGRALTVMESLEIIASARSHGNCFS
jgi:homocitrate synthase NifV